MVRQVSWLRGLGLAIGVVLPAVALRLEAQTKADLMWKRLELTVHRAAEELDGVLAVSIRDLTDGRSIVIRGDEVMPTASMIKIAVLAELYRQNRLGELYTVAAGDIVASSPILGRFTPGVTKLTLRDVATSMIGESDNAATNVLIDRLGMDRVNGLLDGLGLAKTRLNRKMMDVAAAKEGRENVATTNETIALLTSLHQGKLFSAEQTADFFKVLATRKSSRLLALLPEGSRGATKTGTLDGVVVEAGILYPLKRPFAIAVMTSFVRDMPAAERAISGIALAAWQHFARLGTSSNLGRGLPQ
jgi:beta-lactamase class A